MAYYPPPLDPEGTLVVENRSATITEVFFIPDDERLVEAGIDPIDGANHLVRLLTFSIDKGWITIEPTNTLPRHDNFLQPKYSQILRIRIEGSSEDLPETVEDVIEALFNLPSAFTKNPDYGLGLAKDYRFIINAVESLSDCSVLHITSLEETRIDTDGGVFFISERDFDDLRRTINSITPDYSSRKHKMSKRARHVESDQRVTGYPQKTAETRPG